MSNNHAVDVECYGTLKKIPVPNAFITIEQLKSIISSRLGIHYSFNLTHNCAELCDQDSIQDLALNPSHPIRVRKCSIDDSYVPVNSYTPIDLMTDIFLSYERTHQDIVIEMKRKLEDRNYSCWLDVEQIPSNTDHFCSAIEQGIQNSTVFVCCITNRYARSTKCRQELSFATQQGKRIILLLMEDVNWPPHQIGTLVSGLSYIEFYNPPSSSSSTPWPTDKLAELLRKLADVAPQL